MPHVNKAHLPNPFPVIAKFKPEVDEATRQAACNEILALKDKVPNVLTASAGKTFTERSQGFEWGKWMGHWANE